MLLGPGSNGGFPSLQQASDTLAAHTNIGSLHFILERLNKEIIPITSASGGILNCDAW